MKLAKITLGADEISINAALAHCTLCTLYIFTANIGIGSYFIYFHCYLKKDVIRVKFGTHTEATI